MTRQSHLSQARADAQWRKIVSPDVQANRHVVFRLSSPQAKEVALIGRFLDDIRLLRPDSKGIWTIEVGPVPPGIYEYSFSIDGTLTIDPSNSEIKPMQKPHTSILCVPGNPPLLHEFQDVPHGTVHHHSYRSQQLGSQRSIEVYTPPGYERGTRRYPVLVLLPGSGDTEATWLVHGRAHWMMDNLIAQKRAVPMIIVTANGDAMPRKKLRTNGNLNTEGLSRDLLVDVLPLVKAMYRVKKKAKHRAIVGVSRGGGQSLVIGLMNADAFRWIGGISPAIIERKNIVAKALTEFKARNHQPKLLWLACGKDEAFLYTMNKEFDQLLNTSKIAHEFHQTAGSHGWPLWRTYFAEFASRLFR